MDKNTFADFMVRHDLNHADIAWMTGKNIRTVQFWLAGKYPIPQLVTMLCMAIDRGAIDFEWIVTAVAAMDLEADQIPKT